MDPNIIPAGYTFYMNEKGFYDCPVCYQSYKTPKLMNHHVSKNHVYPQDPQSVEATFQTTTQPLQTTSQMSPEASYLSPHIPYTPPSQNLQNVSSQVRKVSATGRKPPSPLSQSEPLSMPQDAPTLQDQEWSESITWPAQTIALLKTLMIEQSLFGNPQSTAEHNKLMNVFRDFYAKVDFPTYKPPFEDQRLWLLFNLKVKDIQAEMLKSGEIYKTNQGYKLSKLPRSTLRVNAPAKEAAKISTPPLTPTKGPADQHLEGMRLWHLLDSKAQAKLFRDMLRTAKDPQSLASECEEYCANRGRDLSSTNVTSPSNSQARVVSNTTSQSSQESNVMTPFDTPPPAQPSKPTDLKSMIEMRLREANLKRQRAKEAEKAQEEGTLKKVKAEPE